MLTIDEWDLIQDLIPVLQPFAAATEILGGSSYCTHSIMNPILIDIKKKLHPITQQGARVAEQINFNNNDETVFDEDIAVEDDEQPPPINATRRIRINEPVNCNGLIDKIKLSLFAAINHYWSDLTSPDMLLPTLLDPRMKDLNFASDSERLATKDLLKKVYEKLKSQNQNNNSSFINVNNDESSKKSKNALSVFANLKKKISPADDEVGAYLLLEEIDLESNPFAWWYERREKFPILSYLARQYLAVFACSTASERLFSDAGNLLTPKRTRMSPKLFRRLMFLKRNSKHLDSIHESHEP